MDAMGIDVEVLSINPFWYRKDRDTAAAIVKLNNERLAELSAAYPKRLKAFASLSLQAPDLAVKQLEEAVTRQGLLGAAIGGSVNGEDFYDPKFHPVWARAEELGAVLFIHPQSPPELANRFKGNGWLSNTIGNPLDTTIALQHLIFEGTLDKFPASRSLPRMAAAISAPTLRVLTMRASCLPSIAIPTSSSRKSRRSI
jgi:aminocarboxymuconate-semialdehyde decarboxylase